MNIRFMRELLFFDLPTNSKAELRAYRHFIRHLKKLGFYMLQESVYVKMDIDPKESNANIVKIKSELPSEGNICELTITEKQFASIDVLLGTNFTDIINSEDRIIIL